MKSKAEVMKDLAKVRRRKITIQRKEMVKDEGGDISEKWVDWQTVWAERSSLWGRDYYAALAVGQEQTIEFGIRYVAFLDELKTDTHRLVYAGDVYNIRQIDYLQDDGMWIKLRAVRQS